MVEAEPAREPAPTGYRSVFEPEPEEPDEDEPEEEYEEDEPEEDWRGEDEYEDDDEGLEEDDPEPMKPILPGPGARSSELSPEPGRPAGHPAPEDAFAPGKLEGAMLERCEAEFSQSFDQEGRPYADGAWEEKREELKSAGLAPEEYLEEAAVAWHDAIDQWWKSYLANNPGCPYDQAENWLQDAIGLYAPSEDADRQFATPAG